MSSGSCFCSGFSSAAALSFHGSLASLRGRRGGRRMMGSGEHGVPISVATFWAFALQLRPLNEIASPAVPTRTMLSAGADYLTTVAFLLKPERPRSPQRQERHTSGRSGNQPRRSPCDAIGSRACSDGYTGLCHAAAVGDFHPPCPQGRPFLAADQKRMRRFVERGARQFVATSAHPSLNIRFTRLIAPWRQPQMSASPGTSGPCAGRRPRRSLSAGRLVRFGQWRMPVWSAWRTRPASSREFRAEARASA